MELVEGEDLSQRIARGPLAIDDALSIAKQVAEALETAHDQGIIHRDLKPANIMVRSTVRQGARLRPGQGDGGDEPRIVERDARHTPVMTTAGMILGTATYMSPEQARGKPVDRRTDIWAFGCVLFEMLAGKQTFASGQSVSDAIAAILSRDPDWSALPVATPPHIRLLLRRCLQKDAQKRLPHIGVARLEIDEGPRPSTVTAGPATTQTGVAKGMRLAAAAAVLLLIVALGVAVTFLRPAAVAPPMYTSSIVPPSDLVGLEGNRLALSPDGRHVAFVTAGEDGRPMVWVRPVSSPTAKPLDGTAGGNSPFWSPDSRQLAFTAGGKLKRIDLAGGSAITLTDTDMSLPGAWSADGVILFPQAQGLFKVSVAGGPPSPVLDNMPELAYYPSFLPDGRHFVYLSARIHLYGFSGSPRAAAAARERGQCDVHARASCVPPRDHPVRPTVRS